MSTEWISFRDQSQQPNCLGLVLQILGLAEDGNYNTRALEHSERCEIVSDPNEVNAAAYVVFSQPDEERCLDLYARIQHVVALDPAQLNLIRHRIQPGADIIIDHTLQGAFHDAEEFDPGGEIVYLRLK